MNAPAPLRRLFATYLRLLLVSAVIALGAVTTALQLGWPVPALVSELYEQITPRIPAAAEHR